MSAVSISNDLETAGGAGACCMLNSSLGFNMHVNSLKPANKMGCLREEISNGDFSDTCTKKQTKSRFYTDLISTTNPL